MKNEYSTPQVEVLFLEDSDVIRTSTQGTETSIKDNGNGNWNWNENSNVNQ
jgi:hypothetical protein